MSTDDNEGTESGSIDLGSIRDGKGFGNQRSRDGAPSTDSSAESHGPLPARDAQRGVQDVEAVTLTWSKGTLIAVFIKYVRSVVLFIRDGAIAPNRS